LPGERFTRELEQDAFVFQICHGLLNNLKFKFLLEVFETRLAYPMLTIGRDIPFSQRIWLALHELVPTELAMIVVPIGTRSLVFSPFHCRALQVPILLYETPVVWFAHKKAGAFSSGSDLFGLAFGLLRLRLGDGDRLARIADLEPHEAADGYVLTQLA